jgi:ubiquinone/menaquinone biosynthesis C-methylase UbiE
MAFAEAFAGQLASPHGAAGRLVGYAMDRANRKPTRLALDLLAPRDGEHILDVGCGTGQALLDLSTRARTHLIGIDPSPLMARTAQDRLGERARIECASLETMEFADASFDAALLLNVLYFCKPHENALARLHRTLKPGGRAAAYVTHRDSMQGWSFTKAGLHRLYDEQQLFTLFADAGFAPASISVQAQPVTHGVTGLLVVAIR